MSAFRRKGRRIHTVKVPTESGVWVPRSTRTRDRVRTKGMQHMVDVLGPKDRGVWDLLRLLTEKDPTTKKPAFTLPALYDLWASTPVTRYDDKGAPIAPSDDERIRHVRDRLRAVDLAPLVQEFHNALVGPSEDVTADTADHYRAAVRLFIPEGAGVVPVTKLNARELGVWIEEMDDVAPATVRKRGIGMRRFVAWLRARGHLAFDPMAEITLPPQGDPLAHYLELADIEQLSEATPGQCKLLQIVLPGSAMELSVALAVRVRQVSRFERSIHAPGTKTYNRNRIVRVADYAWDAVLELVKGKRPDTLMFDHVAHRWEARDIHTAARDGLIEKGHGVYAEMAGGVPHLYTLRDHRHSWAVRAARSGWPIEGIRRQLGHVNGILAVKVYGRFVPQIEEINKWEAMATARDQAVAEEAKQVEAERLEDAQ